MLVEKSAGLQQKPGFASISCANLHFLLQPKATDLTIHLNYPAHVLPTGTSPEATRLRRGSITQLEGQQGRLEKRGLNTPPAEHSWKLRPWTPPGAGCKALPAACTDPSPTARNTLKQRTVNSSCPSHGTSTQWMYNEKHGMRDAMLKSLSSQPTA